MEFVIDKSVSEDMLKRIVAAAEVGNAQLRAEIARNDQLIAQAKIRLINKDLENAEVE